MKITRGIAWGAAIAVLLAFPLFALITYQMGLYELSFINRNGEAETAETAAPPAVTTAGSLVTLPAAETDPTANLTETSGSAESEKTPSAETKAPSETAAVQSAAPESFTKSLYAYSTATGYGFTVNRTPYTKKGQIITLVDGAVDYGDSYSARPAVSSDIPYRKELEHGGYTIEYKRESIEISKLQTYSGYLIVDNGSSYSLADPTGIIYVQNMGAFVPAYLRDASNRPLFTDGERYAYYDAAAKELKVIEDLDPTQLVFGIEYDHNAGYGQVNYGLTPFFQPNETETEVIGEAIPAAFLTGVEQVLTLAAVRGEITSTFRPVSETSEPADIIPEESLPEPADTAADALETAADSEAADSETSESADSTLSELESIAASENTAESEIIPIPDSSADSELPADSETLAESMSETGAPAIETPPTETADPSLDPLPDTTAPIETTPETVPETTAPVVTEPPVTEVPAIEPVVTEPEVTEPPETTEAEAKEAERAAKREERIETNGGLWGYKDAAGNVVIEPQYLKAFNFNSNGLAAVVTADGTQIFINRYNQVILDAYGTIYYHRELYAYDGWYPPEIYTEDNLGMFYFDSGLVRVRKKIVHYTYDHYILEDVDTLIDASGKTFNIPAGYTLEAYSEGVLLLSRDGKYGYMDITGRWLTNLIYTYARPFHEGLAVVGFEGMYVGMIDREGDFIVPMVYNHISDTSMGIFTAYSPSLGWQVFAKLS
ncbi:MAG: WG repeat-containing protein [Clostridia bacterium]|nr:WG repeat-containing protein [Clostridia bacterium]